MEEGGWTRRLLFFFASGIEIFITLNLKAIFREGNQEVRGVTLYRSPKARVTSHPGLLGTFSTYCTGVLFSQSWTARELCIKHLGMCTRSPQMIGAVIGANSGTFSMCAATVMK